MLTLYDYPPSQNAYKVRLLLNHLGLAFETRLVSIFEGEGRRPQYLAINPTGAVPALVLDDGRALCESNAILVYLAEGSAYLPQERFARAKVMQWLSFEGDYVQSGIATLRYWRMTGKFDNRPAELIDAKRALSLKTLSVLDAALARQGFIAGPSYTVADMSLFAYVHLASEAGLALERFTALIRWIEDVSAQPGFLAKTFPYAVDPHSRNELP